MIRMRKLVACLLSVFSITLSIAQTSSLPQLNLVPWPAEVTQSNGAYSLTNKVTVTHNLPAHNWAKLFPYFKSEMKKQLGIMVTEAVKGKPADISFTMTRMPTSGKPAYKLSVSKTGITISSNFDEPAFHAIQTFFQLIPDAAKGKREIPFVEIFDHARFDYRGMHLDVGRHFFPVAFIKRYIDYLAYHKINKFHWHLTEDQGWRIEINKYPLLTKLGGYRNGTIIGRYPGQGNDNKRYGGFYTQKEVKEIVKYAADRFVEVIPEIEMPGHSSAAIAAYPRLSCFPERPTAIPAKMISRKSVQEQKNGRIKLVQETWGVFDDIFCAGNDSVFTFLQNVIDEVTPLFPSKYFHIGGDEAPKTHWKQCPRCQQRMKDQGLKDEHELQSYFVQRIEKYLDAKGKTLIGWDEILEGGLAPNAVVMSWRGEEGGIQAAKENHQVIMTPGNPVYFDHSQSENEDSVTIGGYNPIEKVYAYEPVPKELTAEQGKFVLGAQANVWTEYMKNTKKVEYMIFPRMAALSEVLWSTKENRNWENFEKRLPEQFKRYGKWNTNYSKAYYDLKSAVLPADNFTGLQWELAIKNPAESAIEYSRPVRQPTKDTIPLYDISDPTKIVSYKFIFPGDVIETSTFISPEKMKEKLSLGIKEPGLHSIRLYNYTTRDHHLVMNKTAVTQLHQYFYLNKATGKKITLKEEASKKYPGDGAFTLINGVQNEKGMARSKEFLGFEGKDCEALIDLGSETDLSEIIVHHLELPGSWIYSPASFDIAASADGINFSPFSTTVTITKSADKDRTTLKLAAPQQTRFLKIKILNHGKIAEGNPGAGNRAWLFVDEIEVN
jgi:hexosaminidase